MSKIKKVLEVLASSDKSFEDALQRALTDASATLSGIKSIYIKDQSCRVQDNKITEYRITAKISYETMSQQPAVGHNAGKATAATNDVVGNTTHADQSYIDAPEGVLNDYSDVEVDELPEEHTPGSATTPENGGGYSG